MYQSLHLFRCIEPVVVSGYLSGTALGYGLDDQGFERRQRLRIFFITTASRTAVGPTTLPIQRTPGALSLGVKGLGRKTDLSPPSSAEVKNAWSYTFTPQIRLHEVVLN
jgi:hypothetical protein